MDKPNEPLAKIPQNPLIEFTKWLVKWILIIVLGFSVLIGTGALINEKYIDALVPMISLKCIPLKKEGGDAGAKMGRDLFSYDQATAWLLDLDPYAEEFHWMVQSERFSDTPRGLYQGGHRKTDLKLTDDYRELSLYMLICT